MKTGFIIQRLRNSRGMSQMELAEQLGVRRSYLSQVENDRKQASLDLLRKASRLFEVPLALLVAWDDDTDELEGDKDVFEEMQRMFAHLLSARIGIMKAEGKSRGQADQTTQ